MKSIMNTTLVTDEMLQTYRRDGVVKVPQIITPDEASRFRKIAMDLLEAMPRNPDRPFNQKVNVWRDDPVLKTLTQHPNVAAAAEKLAETRLRIWHDHILAKMPALDAPTAFHQDLVKWPYVSRCECTLGVDCSAGQTRRDGVHVLRGRVTQDVGCGRYGNQRSGCLAGDRA